MDFEKNIDRIRENFAGMKRKRSDRLKRKPFWVETHEIDDQYIHQMTLLTAGKIYYAALVQANVALFKRGLDNYGAVILIGQDKRYDKNPFSLVKYAQGIFSYKDQKYLTGDIRKFADIITDETQYVFNLPVPASLVEGRSTLFTTLIVDRHHLPKGILAGGLFPVLAAPEISRNCMILPKRYWTPEMTTIFSNNLRFAELPFPEYE